MNKARRQQLKKWVNDLENIKAELDGIRYDEEIYFDNMPENFQWGERGRVSEDAIDKMNDAISCIEDAIRYVEEIE